MIRIRFKGSLRCFRPTVSQPFDRAPLGIGETNGNFERCPWGLGLKSVAANLIAARSDCLGIRDRFRRKSEDNTKD